MRSTICARLESMKIHNLYIALVLLLFFSLSGCQSMPASEPTDIDNEVCVGDAVVVDPDKPVDLEEMAKQADCP